MAPVSRAQSSPGYAQASQTPFAIGPGGGSGFGDLLSRQFALREQMQQQQLAQMRQDMLFQKQNQKKQNELYGKSRMVQGGLTAGPGADPSSAYAYDFAKSLPGPGGVQDTNAGFKMIRAIGVPAAHQGMMQSGQIMGQLGSQAIGAGAQMDSNQMQADAQRYGADRRAQTQLQLEGMELQPLPQTGGKSGSLFKSFEDGGRVPKTDTYKLHKGEVVVPRKAADVMFPYACGGPKKSKGKSKKSYQKGSLTQEQIAEFLKNYSPYPDWQRSDLPPQDPIHHTEGLYPSPPIDPRMLEPMPDPGLPPEQPPVELQSGLQPPPSAGGITYQGPNPNGGGMTKFGVPGKLPGGPFEIDQSLGTAVKQDDWVDMQRKEDEAMISDRAAAVAEQRGDKLERYLNEQSTPNRELVAMIKENDRAAQRWRKRSAELRSQADKTKSQLIGQSLATMEQDTERMKIRAEAGTQAEEVATDKYSKLQEDIKVAGGYLKGQEINDYAIGQYQQTIVAAFMPFIDRFDFLGDTLEDRAAAIGNAALKLANAGNEQERQLAEQQFAGMLKIASGIKR